VDADDAAEDARRARKRAADMATAVVDDCACEVCGLF
jgi:hypothetical protein